MNTEEVRKVAKLARLKMSDAELLDHGQQLTAVLDYVSLLNEVDIEDVAPMPHAIETRNNFRDDVMQPSLTRKDALANAPQTDGLYFVVPQILGEKGGR
jgi:aspartyl-tRNA(Asn)/glutamyl-tRNA(Gln) amidotransferase subunit C